MNIISFFLLAAIAATDTDILPDFSRVGYHYSDKEIPTVEVKEKVTAKSLKKGIKQYKDTTAYLQSVIDRVGKNGGGAILLENGVYNTSRTLFIDYSNVVLRGESQEGTIIKCHGVDKKDVIAIGQTVEFDPEKARKDEVGWAGRTMTVNKLRAAGAGGAKSYGSTYLVRYNAKGTGRSVWMKSATTISEDLVPVGRLHFEVENASKFKAGEHIVLVFKATPEWHHDTGMDRMACNGREGINAGTVQWPNRKFDMYWERVITKVEGNTIFVDAPVVMELTKKYGPVTVAKAKFDRISESGVENLTIDSTYDPTIMKGDQYIDENHAWTAVYVFSATHCWVRNVTSKHMGYALANIGAYARNITVTDCDFQEPVSIVTGARRYAFCLTKGELCLFKNCRFDNDRHGCVTNGTVTGPNVYTQCEGTNMQSVIGPHQSWATGCLFDCIKSDAGFECQDRGNYGTGHGWAGANFVFWNCESTKKDMICQNPWASAKNYCIGFIGKKTHGRNYERDYYGQYTQDWFIQTYGKGPDGESRPDGEWYPQRGYNTTGGEHIALPHDGGQSWWPKFTLTSFKNPLSLFECQLEERHAQGIDLSNLE